MKVIYHHLGLGDHIICNGLVRWFADRYKDAGILLFCKHRNFNNVQRMYEDNDKIGIFSIEDDKKAESILANDPSFEVLRCGRAIGGKSLFNGTIPLNIDLDGTASDFAQFIPTPLWDEEFYHHAGLNFQISFTRFHVNRDIEAEQKLYDTVSGGKPLAFIHNRDSRGIDGIDYKVIDKNLQWVFSDPRIPFFDYMKVIEQAEQIHCVDSAFKHLVERLDTKGQLFYHRKKHPKPFDEHTTRKTWIES